jgi:hypothetical protein
MGRDTTTRFSGRTEWRICLQNKATRRSQAAFMLKILALTANNHEIAIRAHLNVVERAASQTGQNLGEARNMSKF